MSNLTTCRVNYNYNWQKRGYVAEEILKEETTIV